MVEDVKLILSKNVEEVIASTLSLKLLNCASKLYFNGAQCRFCARSQREYYSMLQRNGLELAAKFEIMSKEKTFKLTFSGIRYIPKVGNIMMATLDEDTAIQYLNDGTLRESDFIKLPDGYKKAVDKSEPVDEAISEEQTIDSFAKTELEPELKQAWKPSGNKESKRPYNKRK